MSTPPDRLPRHETMRSPRFLFTTTGIAFFLLAVVPAPQADAQGLLRRLRDRIAPLLPPPPSPMPMPPNNVLPARPLPGSNGVNGGLPGSPTARYRLPTDSYGRGRINGRTTLEPLAPVASSRSAGPSIGIQAAEANPGYPAVQVTGILPNSHADEAGLRVGDYIFAIDGIPTPSLRTLARQVSLRRPDENVQLRVGRSGEVFDLQVPLSGAADQSSSVPDQTATLPAPNTAGTVSPSLPAPRQGEPGGASPATADPQERYGLRVADLPGRRGVRVQEINAGSPADAAGLKVNDRIVSVDGRLVSDASGLGRLLASRPPEASREVRLIRQDRLVEVTLDRSAKAPAPQATTKPAAETNGGGTLGSIGSLLGGVFGNKPDDAVAAQNAKEQNVADEKPAAMAEPNGDALALDDIASEDSGSGEADDQAAIEEQIRRLREQLESLESRLED